MTEVISENEAISISLAISTAMLNDDKQAREIVYNDLTTDDLKRVLRWTTRMFLTTFSALSIISGKDPDNAWVDYCAGYSLSKTDED